MSEPPKLNRMEMKGSLQENLNRSHEDPNHLQVPKFDHGPRSSSSSLTLSVHFSSEEEIIPYDVSYIHTRTHTRIKNIFIVICDSYTYSIYVI